MWNLLSADVWECELDRNAKHTSYLLFPKVRREYGGLDRHPSGSPELQMAF